MSLLMIDFYSFSFEILYYFISEFQCSKKIAYAKS
ncbi:Uncharacterised protein [Serratia quinivorans]|nr:Uncharacterised protein [Serratia quinivorans]VEI68407.1 Uncharacterised protein [Serratia quinivorans]